MSFAALKMNPDLGFSDRVYGLGVAMFFVGYVLFEVPGAIIAERWSARKWTARIMISWGLVTILSGLVESPGQFYAARFFLGMAEASFFPAMIVYLTHWIRLSERGRAIASLYAAIPSSAVIGSPLAAWLLGIGWRGIAGWRYHRTGRWRRASHRAGAARRIVAALLRGRGTAAGVAAPHGRDRSQCRQPEGQEPDVSHGSPLPRKVSTGSRPGDPHHRNGPLSLFRRANGRTAVEVPSP